MIRITRDKHGNHICSVFPLPASRPVRKLPIVVRAIEMPSAFSVETLEGTMEGKKGDFLITGGTGERYPIDRDIFFASYEFVDEVPA